MRRWLTGLSALAIAWMGTPAKAQEILNLPPTGFSTGGGRTVQQLYVFLEENVCPYLDRGMLSNSLFYAMREGFGETKLTLADVRRICDGAAGRTTAVRTVAPAASALSNEDLVSRYRPAVVSLLATVGNIISPVSGVFGASPGYSANTFRIGSGFHIGDGLIVANLANVRTAQVVELLGGFLDPTITNPGADKLRVELFDGSVRKVRMLRFDPSTDLVLLSMEGSLRNLGTLPISLSAPIELGQRVLTIGTPSPDIPYTVSQGQITGIRPRGNLRILQTNTPISTFSPGSPLISQQGAVIGIISQIAFSPEFQGSDFYYDELKELGFAIPIQEAFQRLQLTPGRR
ncbi:MAG: trypsin-like peptidase domain-containing protein [Gloeomargaritaceae cyanobacterium C42_A2020_066]|nr:trypsin-like peptidase domain-containing protein [Gloeomargaritaceae cyanobacterium C42_A2020_066]